MSKPTNQGAHLLRARLFTGTAFLFTNLGAGLLALQWGNIEPLAIASFAWGGAAAIAAFIWTCGAYDNGEFGKPE